MSTFHYFIFLTCLTFLNIAVLYTYFALKDAKFNEVVRNEYCTLSLEKAYFIQALFLLAGAFSLFYFSSDKKWFDEVRFLPFLSLLCLVGFLGLFSEKSKISVILSTVLEWGGIIGFVSLLPENPLFKIISLPEPYVQILIGSIWFLIYKFFCFLSNRFKEVILIQSFHIGLSSFFILLLISFDSAALPQIACILLPLTIFLFPLCCIFKYELPLKSGVQNIFCLFITGISFFTIPSGNWGVGFLMIIYVLFEFFVATFSLAKRLIKRNKEPLFFFEKLMNKNISRNNTIYLIMHYNFLSGGIMLLILYSGISYQLSILSAILYLKMYLNILSPETAKSGIIDLFKEAKKTAKTSISETSKAFSDLKKVYGNKEKTRDENDDTF